MVGIGKKLGDKALIAQVEKNKVCIIVLETGNRYTSPIHVDYPYDLSNDELKRMGIERFILDYKVPDPRLSVAVSCKLEPEPPMDSDPRPIRLAKRTISYVNIDEVMRFVGANGCQIDRGGNVIFDCLLKHGAYKIGDIITKDGKIVRNYDGEWWATL